jgi:GNAT superfamily N-acetyltransferase
VRVLDLGGWAETGPPSPAAPIDEWLAAFAALNALSDAHRATLTRILARLVPTACYALVQRDGQAVAAGLGVLQDGYLGLYDIVTAEAARRQGFGRELVAGLLAWGRVSRVCNIISPATRRSPCHQMTSPSKRSCWPIRAAWTRP